jgi:peroxiredoxin Q/BCP
MKWMLFGLCAVVVAVIAIPTARAAAAALEVGVAAPKPEATDEEGKAIAWDQVFTNRWVLIYSYPKADTPGCTAQACSLRDEFAKLTDKGVKVFGVSTDKAEAQRAFKAKHNLPFTLIPDTQGRVLAAYGIGLIPVMGLAKREAILVREGRVVWIDRAASTAKQAADVLAQIEAAK